MVSNVKIKPVATQLICFSFLLKWQMMVREKKMMMMRKRIDTAHAWSRHRSGSLFFICFNQSFFMSHHFFPQPPKLPTNFIFRGVFFFLNIILVFLNILRHNLIAVADLCHCSCVTQVHFPGVFFFFFTKKNIYFVLSVCHTTTTTHHHLFIPPYMLRLVKRRKPNNLEGKKNKTTSARRQKEGKNCDRCLFSLGG